MIRTKRMTRVLLVFLALFSSLPTLASVSIHVATPLEIDAQNRVTWRVSVSNDTAIPNVMLTFSSGGEDILSAPAECVTNFRTRTDCKFDLDAAVTRELVFVTQAIRRYGHNQANVSLGATNVYTDAIFAREYVVTNTNDAGAGSLRQALLDINRDCAASTDPCAPVFHIEEPLPAEGWFTIRPLSPLPRVSGDVFIDGRTQSRFTSDTNPSGGPAIFLDGSLAGWGHGIASDAHLRVEELAIGNFPGNGIDSVGGYLEVNRCWIGVDPTGVHAAPNGLRGIQSENAAIEIAENVLSGNLRAGGFFVTDPLQYGHVRFNLVGVGADGVTPIGNGASGLFFHKSSAGYGFLQVRGNTLAYNAHAGIALSTTAEGDFGENSFVANHGRAIDIALDGPTLETRAGLPSQGGIVGTPLITSARFENGATIVTGRPPVRASTLLLDQHMYLYADGELVAIVNAREIEPSFSVRIERDLRGRAITASIYQNYIYDWDSPAMGTSELSEPLRVE